MREILFRGKSKGTGKWVEGNYQYFPLSDGSLHTMISVWGEFTKDVRPSSVGQYTGLTDKNGVPIYEGDIIAGALSWLEKKKNGVVTFRDGSFGLLWYRGEAEQFNPFTSMCNVEYEVIGNITDSPELLRQNETN